MYGLNLYLMFQNVYILELLLQFNALFYFFLESEQFNLDNTMNNINCLLINQLLLLNIHT